MRWVVQRSPRRYERCDVLHGCGPRGVQEALSRANKATRPPRALMSADARWMVVPMECKWHASQHQRHVIVDTLKHEAAYTIVQ